MSLSGWRAAAWHRTQAEASVVSQRHASTWLSLASLSLRLQPGSALPSRRPTSLPIKAQARRPMPAVPRAPSCVKARTCRLRPLTRWYSCCAASCAACSAATSFCSAATLRALAASPPTLWAGRGPGQGREGGECGGSGQPGSRVLVLTAVPGCLVCVGLRHPAASLALLLAQQAGHARA